MCCRVPFRASSCLTQPFFEPNTLLFQVFEALSSGNTWCHFLMRCPWCSRLTEYLTHVYTCFLQTLLLLTDFERAERGFQAALACLACNQFLREQFLLAEDSCGCNVLTTGVTDTFSDFDGHRVVHWYSSSCDLFIIKPHVQHKTANCWTHLRSPCNISFLPWDSTPIPPKTLFETNQLLQTTDLCWGNL